MIQFLSGSNKAAEYISKLKILEGPFSAFAGTYIEFGWTQKTKRGNGHVGFKRL